MREIHWIAVKPTPYNSFLFRSLAKESGIDLTVHFKSLGASSHPWTESLTDGFPSRAPRTYFGLDFKLLARAVQAKSAFFVVAGWRDPRTVGLLNTLIAFRRPFAIWTDTPRIAPNGGSSPAAVTRQLWLQRVFGHAEHVLGTGEPAANGLVQLGCPPEKIVNFPFFVDLDLLRPKLPRHARSMLRFLSSGRLDNKRKGWDLAVRGLALARDRVGTDRFEYIIAGVGPDQLRLEALIRKLKLSSQVRLCGWLEPTELPDFYRSGDALLHPARYDPFPVVVLEAMACGLPVIGSRSAGSIRDRVVPGVSGLVHENEDLSALVTCLTDVLTHPHKLDQMSHQARRIAELWPVERGIEVIKSITNA